MCEREREGEIGEAKQKSEIGEGVRGREVTGWRERERHREREGREREIEKGRQTWTVGGRQKGTPHYRTPQLVNHSKQKAESMTRNWQRNTQTGK